MKAHTVEAEIVLGVRIFEPFDHEIDAAFGWVVDVERNLKAKVRDKVCASSTKRAISKKSVAAPFG